MAKDTAGEVTALGYVVITASDLDAWKTFAEDGLGLAAVASPTNGTGVPSLRLRMDERSWRLAVEQGDDGGLAALGFEVGSRESLERLVDRLTAAGLTVNDDAELAQHRGVSGLARMKDPAGIPLELFYGAPVDKVNFVSPTGARFVTGPQGMGHAVITVDDAEAAYDFYIRLLGFRLSDIIDLGPMGEMNFTSPNSRHHSLAFGAFTGVPGGLLQHIMVEVQEFDTVGRALDHCTDHAIPIRNSLGKHTNDHVVSFYCQSPSGLAIEYGHGGRLIEGDLHQVGRYDAPSFWGHRPPAGDHDIDAEIEAMADKAASKH